MLTHRQSLWLLAKALGSSTGALWTLVFAVGFVVWGLSGPTPEGRVAGVLRQYVDPYRYLIAFVLLGVAAHLATRKAISEDHRRSRTKIANIKMQNELLALRRAELEELRKPRVEFILIDGCCCRGPVIMIGVAGKSLYSFLHATVYVDIPRLGVRQQRIAWATAKSDLQEVIDIHQGGHHHTQVFASVGDEPCQFFFMFGYVPRLQVDPGSYEISLCAKALDAMAVTAKMEVTFSIPRSITARLL